MITPDEQILICAVRYALGRMSYIVGEVCDYVHHKRERLSDECKKIITYDIQKELKIYHDCGDFLGMECDEKRWVKLLEELTDGSAVEKRNKVPNK